MAEQTGAAKPSVRRRVAHLIWGTKLLPGPVRDGLRDIYRASRRTAAFWQMRRAAGRMHGAPVIRLVVPVVEGTATALVHATVESARRQGYPRWELVIAADDAGPLPAATAGGLRTRGLRTRGRRVRLWEGSASDGGGTERGAVSAALVAPGADVVAVVEPGDTLPPEALLRLAQIFWAEPEVGVVYTDERVPGAGGRAEPDGTIYKPDWAPEHILSEPYTGRLSAYRRALVGAAGGLRTEFGAAREYDLLLRLVEGGAAVRHLPEVLYVRRPGAAVDGAPGRDAAARAVAAHLARTGADAEVVPARDGAPHRVRYHVRGDERVSIIIPTAGVMRPVRGRPTDLLANTVRSIAATTDYGNYEIVYVYDRELPAETLAALAASGAEVRGVPYTRPFNWSDKMNVGAAAATGAHLLSLNDDVEVINAGWLTAMVEYSQQPAVGAVGAMLYFEDGSVQHAGMVFDNGHPLHAFRLFSSERQRQMPELLVARNYSAVTGACLMSRAELFREMGGFRAEFPVNFNDTDYCLRLRARGYRVVLTPYARLFHFESISRAVTAYVDFRPEERGLFDRLWSDLLVRDPYHDSRRTVVW